MRYIFETNDEQGTIGSQINRWVKDGKIELIERGQPVIEIKADMERIARAIETLRKAGYNEKLMRVFIAHDSKVGIGTVGAILHSQEEFFKLIGATMPTYKKRKGKS